MAGAIGGIALVLWFGYGFVDRVRQHPRRGRPGPKETREDGEMEKTPIHKKVEQVLTEARVVLPGVKQITDILALLDTWRQAPPTETPAATDSPTGTATPPAAVTAAK